MRRLVGGNRRTFEIRSNLDICRAQNYISMKGRLAQLARAPRLHRGGQGFESLSGHFRNEKKQARVAKVVTARV